MTLGNGVPLPLGRAIARAVLEALSVNGEGGACGMVPHGF